MTNSEPGECDFFSVRFVVTKGPRFNIPVLSSTVYCNFYMNFHEEIMRVEKNVSFKIRWGKLSGIWFIGKVGGSLE